MADPSIEFIPNRLYWQSFQRPPEPQAGVHFFCTDDLLVYDPYYEDFGPLNISQLARFVRMVDDKLRAAEAEKKKIVYFCHVSHDTRANSALLISAWSMISQGKTPLDAFKPFNAVRTPFQPFRDASLGTPSFHLTIPHVLCGLKKAIEVGFFDVATFDCDEYEHYERVENGDFNWIIRGKFLAFSGPTQTPILYSNDVKTNTPETYYNYFHQNTVTGIVRFNNKVYDRQKFVDAGARPSFPCPPQRRRRAWISPTCCVALPGQALATTTCTLLTVATPTTPLSRSSWTWRRTCALRCKPSGPGCEAHRSAYHPPTWRRSLALSLSTARLVLAARVPSSASIS